MAVAVAWGKAPAEEGVAANHAQNKDVTGEEEVEVHELMAHVLAHGEAEKIRVVEQHNGAGEICGSEKGVRNHLGEL